SINVPIHQEDLAVQRTPLIDPVISMVTEKTTSTPTPPNHTSSCSNVFNLLLERHFKRSLEVLVGARKIVMDCKIVYFITQVMIRVVELVSRERNTRENILERENVFLC
ncbi:hypothetical protein Tco_0248908, partial [Tanacetum coccineum]